jgi:hypothetical protein
MAFSKICVILLVISISDINAQETAEEHENTRMSIYFHPFSLSSVSAIYSTIEIPLNLNNSVIINPSFLYKTNTNLLWLLMYPDGNYFFRLGSGIGLRSFLFGKGEGLYLQAMLGTYYVSKKQTKYSYIDEEIALESMDSGYASDGEIENDREIEKRFFYFDVFSYVGYSWKFSGITIFADIGYGGIPIVYTEKDIFFTLPDINIGIGIPFGTGKIEQKKRGQDKTRVLVYLHPATFLGGLFSTDIKYLSLYSTIEIPFDLGWSLVIRPNFIKELNMPREFKAGSNFGVRGYINQKGEGFYCQNQIGIFYYDAQDLSYEAYSSKNPPELYESYVEDYKMKSSLWLDIMINLGYSWKFSNISIFFDVGIGIGHLDGYSDIFMKSFFLVPDANLGIGIPF